MQMNSKTFSNTYSGLQPTLLDRKRYTTYDSSFAGYSILELSSASRIAGTSIGCATYTLPRPIQAWAVSLKSLVLPVSWPNVTSPVTFSVTYNPTNAYPTSFTLPAGNWISDLYQGQVTYATVSAASAYVNQNDLV